MAINAIASGSPERQLTATVILNANMKHDRIPDMIVKDEY